MSILSQLRRAILLVPSVRSLLFGRARFLSYTPDEYKTYDYMLAHILGLVRGVYGNRVGGNFIDIMANLISGQLTQAYRQAFEDEGFTDFLLPPYLEESLQSMILDQYDYVDGYYRDIIDARIEKKPIDPLLARASLWANRWTEAYNEAVHLIMLNEGGNEMWVLGQTEEHCETCSRLNGIVARASEWEKLGVRPQSAPNDMLACGGWNCDCSRVPTDKRRSPRAFDTILNIITK